MQELSKDVVALLQYLAPGFIVAWVYFGFAPHVKPSHFERVVQALVFTVVVQVLVSVEKAVLQIVGRSFSLGAWNAESPVMASLLTALLLGVVIAALTRQDLMHKMARRLGLTTRSGYPNEHYAVFAEHQNWIALHMKDGTRLFGWPRRWPTEGDKGHYFLTDVERSYLDRPDEPAEDLAMLEGILVPGRRSQERRIREVGESHVRAWNTGASPVAAALSPSRKARAGEREPAGLRSAPAGAADAQAIGARPCS